MQNKDRVSGTNVVYKTVENNVEKWYHFLTNEIIESLTNGDE